MNDARLFMVFDVEAMGLHGEGFAVGYVVVDVKTGEELDSAIGHAHEDSARGFPDDQKWIAANVVPALAAYVPKKGSMFFSPETTPNRVRDYFWSAWTYWKGQGALLAADVAWPVEARFLCACIDEEPRRAAMGPYPLIDIASVRLAKGLDPLGHEEREDYERPAHNPLADARQSARLLLEALKKKG